MDKQEIQKQIDSISADRDVLERTRNKLTGDIALLLQKIAEKPKLGHGDFGLWKFRPTNDPKKAIYIDKHQTKDTIYTDKDEWCRNASDDDGRKLIKFGNIFDLMEGWDKDFETWESSPAYKDAIQIMIEVVEGGIFFGNSGNAATFELKGIIEIWKKLGHAIVNNLRQTKTK